MHRVDGYNEAMPALPAHSTVMLDCRYSHKPQANSLACTSVFNRAMGEL